MLCFISLPEVEGKQELIKGPNFQVAFDSCQMFWLEFKPRCQKWWQWRLVTSKRKSKSSYHCLFWLYYTCASHAWVLITQDAWVNAACDKTNLVLQAILSTSSLQGKGMKKWKHPHFVCTKRWITVINVSVTSGYTWVILLIAHKTLMW